MVLEDLHTALQETGVGGDHIVYGQFEEGEVPTFPWIVFYATGETPFSADDNVYFVRVDVTIELYTQKKEPETEKCLEAVLDDYDLYYRKQEVYVEDEDFFMILYTTSIY